MDHRTQELNELGRQTSHSPQTWELRWRKAEEQVSVVGGKCQHLKYCRGAGRACDPVSSSAGNWWAGGRADRPEGSRQTIRRRQAEDQRAGREVHTKALTLVGCFSRCEALRWAGGMVVPLCGAETCKQHTATGRRGPGVHRLNSGVEGSSICGGLDKERWS